MNDAAFPQDKPASGNGLTGWHVLFIMLGFFGVMFAVNGVFLYHAITSFPGEDVKKSYLQGLSYNETLAARAEAAALGWRAELGAREGELVLHLEDKAGIGVSGRKVEGELRRTTSQHEDRAISFSAGLNGAYSAPLKDLGAGRWDVRVDVFEQDGETIAFSARKTILVGWQ